MTVRDILIEWLKAHKCDGLCTWDCGCGIDDLVPCDSCNVDCNAARKSIATKEDEDRANYGIKSGGVIFKIVSDRELKLQLFDDVDHSPHQDGQRFNRD